MSIDYRSDTVTRPSPSMLQAMTQAEVGDDVLGEDPTVQLLQDRVAHLLNKEAGLFTPSGTMANQLAIACQTSPGDEVLIDVNSHIVRYESGAAPTLSGVQLHTIESPVGGFDVAQLQEAQRPQEYWYPQTRLVVMENTHNHRGGELFDYGRMTAIKKWASKEGLKVHLDGGRLWNASAATDISLADYAACADTVTVCFSKGLGAPIGSMLLGDAETIKTAHRFRKIFGGGMRQVGFLAAAGLFALEHHLKPLVEDHEKAQMLAAAVEAGSSLALTHRVETNIMIVEVVEADRTPVAIAEKLKHHGILAGVWGPRTLRFVTHRDVSLTETERAARVLKEEL